MRQRLAPRLVRAVAGAGVVGKLVRRPAWLVWLVWLVCLLLVADLCPGGNASAASTGFRLQVAALIPGSALSLAQAYDADGCHGGNRSAALH
ncbi:MAG TPA: hypothetical protein VFQ88_12450 [Nevskiaceae bacterium]|nr:hypothetical protein [Nevskiaceae bacterium]